MGKEDTRGEKHSRGALLIWGREHYFDMGRLYWSIFLGRLEDCISGFEFGALLQGSIVARSFGLGSQESLQNPGARESDRLCS